MKEQEKSNFKKILTGTTAAIFLSTYIGVALVSQKSECVGAVDWESGSLALCSNAEGHVIVQSGNTSYILPEGVKRTTQTIFNPLRNKLYYYRDIPDSSLFEVNYLDLKTGELGEPLIL